MVCHPVLNSPKDIYSPITVIVLIDKASSGNNFPSFFKRTIPCTKLCTYEPLTNLKLFSPSLRFPVQAPHVAHFQQPGRIDN